MINPIFLLFVSFLLADNIKIYASVQFYHNDAYPGKCFISNSLILSPGEIAKSPETCVKLYCVNQDGFAFTTGCGLQSFGNCKDGDPVDAYADYPMCCVRHVICPDSPHLEKGYESIRHNAYKRWAKEVGTIGSTPQFSSRSQF